MGRRFNKNVDVPLSRVQPLWFGVDVPKDAKGMYRSSFTIAAKNAKASRVEIELTVEGEYSGASSYVRCGH